MWAHPTALVESADIGKGTRLWAYVHVLPGARIGAHCNLGDHVFVEGGAFIGDNVTIKNGVCVWEGVRLEDGVFVGPGVVFTNDRYPRSARLSAVAARYAGKGWLEPTCVQEGATLGANSTIVCGITIGAYAFIGAGALVNRDVEPHALMLGAPARRRGWVCRCAHPLVPQGERLVCSDCGQVYIERTDSSGKRRLQRAEA